MDIVSAILLLIVFLPIMLIAAIVVRISMGSPVIFKQRRPGLNGRLFTLYKFRSMTNDFDESGKLLLDEERNTGFGDFLRKCSIDELPELFNVLKGDMSMVGPRPLLEEYLNRYTPEQARRHEVRPGITGLAQISGRQNLTFGQRIALDVFYVDHRSLWMDIKILFMTLPKALGQRGVIIQQEIDDVDDIGLNPDSILGRSRTLNKQ
ncbi:MAG: sugar transferase [Armatimonadetes bacterium]|nr:sugar transferase [Armatimonadota bacterium]